jgi:predicted ATPase
LGQLIADAVPCAPEQASGLAELVREKTAGNPLFAIQFLSTAHGGRLWVEANVLRGATFKFMLPAA